MLSAEAELAGPVADHDDAGSLHRERAIGTKYVVEGADATTGQDRRETIVAASQTEAAKIAKDKGMFVSGVREAGNPKPVSTPKPAPPVAPYAGPDLRSVPKYAGLSIAARILSIYALLAYIGGALLLILGLLGAVVAGSQSSGSPLAAATVLATAVGPALAALFAGAMAHGASAALLALRDIAINSFRP